MQAIRTSLHRLIHKLATMRRRARTRAELRRLSPRQLDDIGLAPYQIDDFIAGRLPEPPARPTLNRLRPRPAQLACCPA